jgi:hypothetical protein
MHRCRSDEGLYIERGEQARPGHTQVVQRRRYGGREILRFRPMRDSVFFKQTGRS